MRWLWDITHTHWRTIGVPTVPIAVLLEKAIIKSSLTATSPEKFEWFVQYISDDKAVSHKALTERARSMLHHPSGPQLDHAMAAYEMPKTSSIR